MSTASVRWPRVAGLLMLVCSAGFARAATPQEVADYAIQQALGGNAESVTVWLTPEPLDTTHVARFFTNEQRIDEPFPFQQTWLVLIDLFPAQNFGHACLWMFVEDFDGGGPRNGTSPQFTYLPPVVLANNGQGPRIEFRCRRLTDTPCPRLAGEAPPPGLTAPNGGTAATVGAPDALRRLGGSAPAPRLRDDNPCLHAVLISGGINSDSNYARYPQNIASMYNKLRNCGFPADQIWVYYADGGAIPGVTITGAADKALIRARVQALSPNLDPFNDLLFIYGSNHGADNAGLCLWDMNGDGLGWDEIYTPAELAADTRNSTACRLYVLMDQCFAGEFLDMTTDGEHNRTAVYGAATADESSWGREYLDRWEDQNISALTMNQLHQDVVDNGNLSSTPVMAEGSPGVGDRKLCECCAFEPPECDAGGPYTLQCGFNDRGSVQLDGSASFDSDGQIVRYEWTTDCPGGQLSDPTAVRPTLTFGGACGQTCTVTLTVTDNDGFTSTCSATVNVIDTEPPQISCPPSITIECDESNDPSHTGFPTASDTCDPDPQIDISESSIVLGPCGGTYIITRTWRARDACGNEARCDQVITAVDTTPPTIECTLPAETEVDAACSATIPFSATITDNCCLLLDDAGAGLGAIGVNVSVAGASSDPPQYDITPGADGKSATVSGTVRVYRLTVCPAVVTLTVTADDCCENEAIACTRTGNVVDRIPPQITCPPDAYFDKGSYRCEPAILDWLNSATATDNCDPAPIIGSTAPACGFPAGTTTTVTWTATDLCGNTASCSANITIAPPDRGQPGQKGSLLYFPDVEIKWNAAGQVTQDTFLQISNDFNADVRVQLYFVNGDKPLAASGGERPHPGCNWVDNVIVLTHNEPAYWSVRSGLPKGVAPFIGLDPGTPPGRPDPEGPAGARVLRGYVVGWAVNSAGREIRWNHLTGVATLVDYARGAAWEYGAWAFAASCVANGEEPQDCTLVDANGVCCDAQVIPGQIDFDNFQYDVGPNRLLLDFFATGATALSRAGGPTITHDTDLSLALLAQDLRQDHAPPVKTKVQAEIWNANETSFSGVTRCLECWDQSLLSAYGSHFLRSNLQTDNGRARLDGVGSTQCPDSVSVPLLGVANKILTFSTGPVELSGEPLHMSGYEPAQLLYDVPSAPEEKDAGPK